MSKFYRHFYFPGSSRTVIYQGKRSDLDEFLKQTGMAVIKGKSGSYKLKRVPYGEILEYEDENSDIPTRKIRPSKNFLSKHYQKRNIKESDYARLATEMNLGEESFDELYEHFGI